MIAWFERCTGSEKITNSMGQLVGRIQAEGDIEKTCNMLQSMLAGGGPRMRRFTRIEVSHGEELEDSLHVDDEAHA